ncbi:microfibrillar-associated protein 1-like [Actinia tenebrosa]|uniref:Microfibrillar-associated protein 1-like n=1 Tax=Actinia tenebrosa TaxID=6105 RepID=A0A6P8I0Z0_ACTTE|nr:microfibrillar-associated protein 1-like [Actinia tenebrosa]
MSSQGTSLRIPLNCAAGAVPVRNEKGEITMEKVKVTRYVAGKRPEYAKYSRDEEEDEMEVFGEQVKGVPNEDQDLEKAFEQAEKTDRRLRRLQERAKDDEEGEDVRHRLHEPEVIMTGDHELSGDEIEAETRQRLIPMEEESSDEEELDEEAIERRREILRQKARQQQQTEQDLLDIEDEAKSEAEEEEDSSEYEEYSDSEEETGPRLKPVFVRRSDRVTVQEREKMEVDEEKKEEQKKKVMEERKKTSRKLVEELMRKERQEEQGVEKEEQVVISDTENDEEAYEAWKLRELKRIKRDRDERDQIEKERLETERIRGMSEEQRRLEFKTNPKQVTNKSVKGKYKFLQKYYHRGAFFLDEENTVYKRDFATPTLEDHFDKTILPKVMQVKNFGRSGRTKYTHLADQDTTQFESAWAQDNPLAVKFHSLHAGGSKQSFDRPSKKRK